MTAFSMHNIEMTFEVFRKLETLPKPNCVRTRERSFVLLLEMSTIVEYC